MPVVTEAPVSSAVPTASCEPPADASGVIACVVYENGRRVRDVPIADISEVIQTPGQFIWIGLCEPSDALLAEVQAEFGLHDLAIEDARKAHQRPKLERYDNSLFVVLRPGQLGATGQVELGETHVFLGPNYIVTVRHGTERSHVGVRARCESQPALLALGPSFALYALMDFIVDQYLPIVDSFDEQLGELEAEIFGSGTTRDTTSRIYLQKRDLLKLKRAVFPLVDMSGQLARFADDLVPEPVRVYFRDVYDHALRCNEMIDTLRELLGAALDANLSLIAVAQNEQMKRLAAWAAIIAVPTAVAGIYGMNFEHMPELSWAYGYPAAIGVMAGACLTLFALFKRSGWL